MLISEETRKKLVKDMADAAFVMESYAHLRGMEREMLPFAEGLRADVKLLETGKGAPVK